MWYERGRRHTLKQRGLNAGHRAMYRSFWWWAGQPGPSADYTALQRQQVVTAYLKSKQLPPFAFAREYKPSLQPPIIPFPGRKTQAFIVRRPSEGIPSGTLPKGL